MSDTDEPIAPQARMIATFLREKMDMDAFGYFIAVFPLDTEGMSGVEGVFSENMNPEFLGEALRLMAERVVGGDAEDLPLPDEKPN